MIRIREIDYLEERASSMTVYTVVTTIVVSLLIGAVGRPVAAAVPTIANRRSYFEQTAETLVGPQRAG